MYWIEDGPRQLHHSPTSSDDHSSVDCEESDDDDDDSVNCRIKPYWFKYVDLFEAHGIHLDTVRDVRPHYLWLKSFPGLCLHSSIVSVIDSQDGAQNDHDLFPDPSLPDNLFRARRHCDGKRLVVKAVHSGSDERAHIAFLSHPGLRSDPMNHTIPIIDILECREDHIAFIVMEQWSPHLFDDPNSPCCLLGFLASTRQFIEHVAFMHKHNIAHLDISVRNLVTNPQGYHAFIDFELSRRSKRGSCLYMPRFHSTEIPPECETRDHLDPFKMDVWALGILILRTCKMSGYQPPQLLHLTTPMLCEVPEHRPSAKAVLEAFDKMMLQFRPGYRIDCSNVH